MKLDDIPSYVMFQEILQDYRNILIIIFNI